MSRITGTTNEQALAEFVAARVEIDRLLAELAALSADHLHASPEVINRGHVGTTNHIRDRLREIADFANGRG